MYQWFDCHLPGTVVSQGISQPNAENCPGFPPPLDSRHLRSRIAQHDFRPIYRAPLGHTLFYCQGALFPWPDKTCNQFPIQFFTISRRNHSKWFCCYINYTSGHALPLKQTMNRHLIPDSYPFLLPISILCTEISLHKWN